MSKLLSFLILFPSLVEIQIYRIRYIARKMTMCAYSTKEPEEIVDKMQKLVIEMNGEVEKLTKVNDI